MVSIYTLTLSLPSIPPPSRRRFTRKVNFAAVPRCLSPAAGINVARAITHLGGKATAIFPAGGATGEHLVSAGR